MKIDAPSGNVLLPFISFSSRKERRKKIFLYSVSDKLTCVVPDVFVHHSPICKTHNTYISYFQSSRCRSFKRQENQDRYRSQIQNPKQNYKKVQMQSLPIGDPCQYQCFRICGKSDFLYLDPKVLDSQWVPVLF